MAMLIFMDDNMDANMDDDMDANIIVMYKKNKNLSVTRWQCSFSWTITWTITDDNMDDNIIVMY